MIKILEVKTDSPFNDKKRREWDNQLGFCMREADWISIHTNPKWGGSYDQLRQARKQTGKPIVAKGVHMMNDDIEKALDFGADYVTVVGRIPDKNKFDQTKLLIEPLNLNQLKQINTDHKIIWNQKNILSGKTRNQIDQARQLTDNWLCQASKIRTYDDVNPNVQAVLVGTYKYKFISSYKNHQQS